MAISKKLLVETKLKIGLGLLAIPCSLFVLSGCEGRTIAVDYRSRVPTNGPAVQKSSTEQPIDARATWTIIKGKAEKDPAIMSVVQRIEASSFFLTIEREASTPLSLATESKARVDPIVELWKKSLKAASEKSGQELLVSLQSILAIFETYNASPAVTTIDTSKLQQQLSVISEASPASISRLRKTLNRPPVLKIEESVNEPILLAAFLAGKVVATDPDLDEATLAYQWQSSVDAGKTFVDITGASAAQFQPTLTEAHAQLRYVVKASDNWGGDASFTSKTFQVQNSLPILSGTIAILGTLQQGTTASVDLTGHTTDPDGDLLTIAYQWQFSGDGVTFVDMPGEITKDLLLTDISSYNFLRCKITLNDGFQGTTSGYSQVQPVANRMPLAFFSTISALDTLHVGKELLCSGTAIDPDGDSLSYSYIWRMSANGTTFTDIGGSVGSTLVVSAAQAHKYLLCQKSAVDALGHTVSAVSASVQILNSAPSVPTLVSISPVNPGQSATLTCTASGSTDVDGDSVSYTYAWKKNDVIVNGATAQTLAGGFVESDRMRCIAFASDSVATSLGVTSSEVQIGNTLPGAPTAATLSPASFSKETASITCSHGAATDLDGDLLTYEYQWLKNGSAVAAWSAAVTTLSNASYQKGDTIACSVRAIDSVGAGSAAFSATAAVQNSAPSVPTSVSISPASPGQSATLTCTASGSTDVDGDSVSYTYAWKKNDVIVNGATAQTLAGGFVNTDRIRCIAFASDSVASSLGVTSSEVEIGNTLPGAPTAVTLSPASFSKATASITCSHGVATDPDGDLLTYEYQWLKNGSAVAAWSAAATTLSNASYQKGDTIACSVRAKDSVGVGSEASSATASVQNTAVSGTISCATFPIIGAQGSSFSATCTGASDTDGNSDFSYQYASTTGACPTMGADGALSDTLGVPGTCSFTVKACDSGGCTAASASYAIHSYSLSSSLGAASLSAQCKISVPATVTASGNLSGLTYAGNIDVAGQTPTVSATGVEAQLTSSSASGTYAASFGVTGASLAGSFYGAITASANPLGFILNKTLGAAVTAVIPASRSAATGQWVHNGVEALRSIQAGECQLCPNGRGSIALGGSHGCAVTPGGGLKCWGGNTAGQLGDNTLVAKAYPVDVSGLGSGVVQVAAGGSATGGYGTTCAVLSSGAAKCWGQNESSQLGTGGTTNTQIPTDVTNLASGVAMIAPGVNHTCALTTAGAVYCWGSYYLGANGSTLTKTAPFAIPSLASGIVSIGAGYSASCAVLSGGSVKCWGGTNASGTGEVPVVISNISDAVQVVVAGQTHTAGHACALRSNGAVKCWGSYNAYGQLGNNTTTASASAVDVVDVTNAVQVSVGISHSCALIRDGTVKCWGLGSSFGYGKNENSTALTVDGLGGNVIALSASQLTTCGLLGDGSVRCIGGNDYGMRGNGSPSATRFSPAPSVPLTGKVIAISSGASHSCAILSVDPPYIQGNVYCWGAANWLGIGGSTLSFIATPTAVVGLTTPIKKIVSSGNSTCALDIDGRVWCWGGNGNGQLGDGTTNTRASAAETAGLGAGNLDIAFGGAHFCAVTSAGAVKCTGYNYYNQLGDGTATQRQSMVSVPSLTSGIKAVAAGSSHTCALGTNDKVYCWGGGWNNQLGLGADTATKTTPQEVTAVGTNTAILRARGDNTCVVTKTAGLKCWGPNASNLFTVGANPLTTATDIAGATSDIADISIGGYGQCIKTTSGGFKCWGGSGDRGIMGNGTNTSTIATPTDVVGFTSGGESINMASEYTCASKTDGTLWCWGWSGYAYQGVFADGFAASTTWLNDSGGSLSALTSSCTNFSLSTP